MRFAPKLSTRDRNLVERALPRVLAGGEVPVFAASCTAVSKLQAVVIITRERFVGINAEGAIVQELPTAYVSAYEVTTWMTLTLFAPDGKVKFGTVNQKDVAALGDAIAEVCPRIARSTDAAERVDVSTLRVRDASPSPTSTPRHDGPESTGSSLVDGLSRLAELHAQGALTAAEYEAAKRTMLGPSGQLAQPPGPVRAPRTEKRRGRKVKEMERTCRRDGTVWFVPLDVARARKPNWVLRGGLGTSELASTGFLAPGGTTASTQLGRLDAAWARAQSARQCPECGSQAFTEREVKH